MSDRQERRRQERVEQKARMKLFQGDRAERKEAASEAEAEEQVRADTMEAGQFLFDLTTHLCRPVFVPVTDPSRKHVLGLVLAVADPRMVPILMHALRVAMVQVDQLDCYPSQPAFRLELEQIKQQVAGAPRLVSVEGKRLV